MHYYSFHIKDYHLATSHLTLEEDGCYRRILDFYYDSEGHLPDIKTLARKIRVAEEMAQAILTEFFVFEGDKYVNRKIGRAHD